MSLTMTFLQPIFDNIPDELKILPQWVLWKAETREGKITKPPYKPQGGFANSTDPLTWSTFDACKKCLESF